MGCISGIVKYFVFIVNFVFALAGLVLTILGCIFEFSYVNKLTTDTIPTEFSVASIVVIIVGITIFIISFLGCYGSIKANSCMLKTYAAILLTILIIEVAIGVYAFIRVKRSDFKTDLDEILKKPFKEYTTNNDYKDVVDSLQETLECCGENDYKDWDKIPPSCCADKKKNCLDTSSDLYKSGCLDEMYNLLDTAFTILGVVIIVIAVTEVSGAILGIYLAKKGGHQYY